MRLYTRTEGWREVEVFDDFPPVWKVREVDHVAAEIALRTYFTFGEATVSLRGREIACMRRASHVHPLWNPVNLGYGWLDVVYVEPEPGE